MVILESLTFLDLYFTRQGIACCFLQGMLTTEFIVGQHARQNMRTT